MFPLFLGTSFFWFLSAFLKVHVCKVINYFNNKFGLSLVFYITYPSPNALIQCKLRAFEYAEIQYCFFFDFGVQQMLKILIEKWTKAFSEGYVISKTKVKRNLLVVFKKSTWSNSESNKKKVSQVTIWYYSNKIVNHIYYQLRFKTIF